MYRIKGWWRARGTQLAVEKAASTVNAYSPQLAVALLAILVAYSRSTFSLWVRNSFYLLGLAIGRVTKLHAVVAQSPFADVPQVQVTLQEAPILDLNAIFGLGMVVLTISFASVALVLSRGWWQEYLLQHLFRSPAQKAVFKHLVMQSVNSTLVSWMTIFLSAFVFEMVVAPGPGDLWPFFMSWFGEGSFIDTLSRYWDSGLVPLVHYLLTVCTFHAINLNVIPSNKWTRRFGFLIFVFGMGVYRIHHPLVLMCRRPFIDLLVTVYVPNAPVAIILGLFTVVPCLIGARLIKQYLAPPPPPAVDKEVTVFARIFAEFTINAIMTCVGISYGRRLALAFLALVPPQQVLYSGNCFFMAVIFIVALYFLLRMFAVVAKYLHVTSPVLRIGWGSPKAVVFREDTNLSSSNTVMESIKRLYNAYRSMREKRTIAAMFSATLGAVLAVRNLPGQIMAYNVEFDVPVRNKHGPFFCIDTFTLVVTVLRKSSSLQRFVVDPFVDGPVIAELTSLAKIEVAPNQHGKKHPVRVRLRLMMFGTALDEIFRTFQGQANVAGFKVDLKLKMGSLLPSRVMPILRVEDGRLIWLDASPLSDSNMVFDIVDQLGSIARAIDHIQSDHMRYWLDERVTHGGQGELQGKLTRFKDEVDTIARLQGTRKRKELETAVLSAVVVLLEMYEEGANAGKTLETDPKFFVLLGHCSTALFSIVYQTAVCQLIGTGRVGELDMLIVAALVLASRSAMSFTHANIDSLAPEDEDGTEEDPTEIPDDDPANPGVPDDDDEDSQRISAMLRNAQVLHNRLDSLSSEPGSPNPASPGGRPSRRSAPITGGGIKRPDPVIDTEGRVSRLLSGVTQPGEQSQPQLSADDPGVGYALKIMTLAKRGVPLLQLLFRYGVPDSKVSAAEEAFQSASPANLDPIRPFLEFLRDPSQPAPSAPPLAAASLPSPGEPADAAVPPAAISLAALTAGRAGLRGPAVARSPVEVSGPDDGVSAVFQQLLAGSQAENRRQLTEKHDEIVEALRRVEDLPVEDDTLESTLLDFEEACRTLSRCGLELSEGDSRGLDKGGMHIDWSKRLFFSSTPYSEGELDLAGRAWRKSQALDGVARIWNSVQTTCRNMKAQYGDPTIKNHDPERFQKDDFPRFEKLALECEMFARGRSAPGRAGAPAGAGGASGGAGGGASAGGGREPDETSAGLSGDPLGISKLNPDQQEVCRRMFVKLRTECHSVYPVLVEAFLSTAMNKVTSLENQVKGQSAATKAVVLKYAKHLPGKVRQITRVLREVVLKAGRFSRVTSVSWCSDAERDRWLLECQKVEDRADRDAKEVLPASS